MHTTQGVCDSAHSNSLSTIIKIYRTKLKVFKDYSLKEYTGNVLWFAMGQSAILAKPQIISKNGWPEALVITTILHFDWTLSARGSDWFTVCIHSTNPLPESVGFHSGKHWKNNLLQGSPCSQLYQLLLCMTSAVSFSAFSWAQACALKNSIQHPRILELLQSK